MAQSESTRQLSKRRSRPATAQHRRHFTTARPTAVATIPGCRRSVLHRGGVQDRIDRDRIHSSSPTAVRSDVFAGGHRQHPLEKVLPTVEPVPQSFELRVQPIRQTLFDKLTIRGGRIFAAMDSGPVTVMIFIGDPVHLPALSGVPSVTAVAIRFRYLCKGFASVTWVEVDIPAEVPVIALVLDREGFVASLKHVSATTVLLGVPVGIAGEPVLHPSAQVRLRRFDQGVDVVGHPAVGNHDPSAAIDLFGQTASETFIVAVVVKDSPASIAPGDEVIDGTGVLKSRQTGHRAIDPTGSTGKLNVAYQPLTPHAIPNPESDPWNPLAGTYASSEGGLAIEPIAPVVCAPFTIDTPENLSFTDSERFSNLRPCTNTVIPLLNTQKSAGFAVAVVLIPLLMFLSVFRLPRYSLTFAEKSLSTLYCEYSPCNQDARTEVATACHPLPLISCAPGTSNSKLSETRMGLFSDVYHSSIVSLQTSMAMECGSDPKMCQGNRSRDRTASG